MDLKIELIHLKEEVFKEIRDLESKFVNMFHKKNEDIESKNQNSLKKIELIMKKNEQMFNSINNQQLKIDKIGELELFRNKTDGMIISHECRINSISRDVEDIKFKYEREVIQNLIVPGFIGPSCQFKTISDYILFNINEMSKLKTEKDATKKDNKEIKTKIDSVMKSIFNLVDNSVTRCNEYTDTKQKYLETLLNSKFVELGEKHMEMKTQVIWNHNKLEEGLKKLANLSEEMKKMRDTLDLSINNKYNELKIIVKDLSSKIEIINDELIIVNKNFENISSTLKKSGIIVHTKSSSINNKSNYKTMSKIKNRSSFVKVNNTYNTMSSNNLKKYDPRQDKLLERKHRKTNTIIEEKKYEINDSTKESKANDSKTLIKKTDKKSVNININDSNNIDNPINKISENRRFKRNSVFHLKSNINIKTPVKNEIFKKKIENNIKLNSINKYKANEKKINVIMKKNEKNKNISSSDDDSSSKKSENISSKSIENENDNIYINDNTINKNNSLNIKIKNINNSQIKIKNIKDEILNLKNNHNFINRNKNLSLDSRNNILLDKLCEVNNRAEIEKKTKKLNGKNNNIISTLHKYKKEPIIITQTISKIKFPNAQIINKGDKKDDLFQAFLERHNIVLNNSSEIKKKKMHNNTNIAISNRFYGTSNEIYKHYDNTFSNNFYKIENKNITLIKKDPLDFKINNNRTALTQSNNRRRIYNMDVPENVNYKIISLDNKYRSSLSNQKKRTRNKLEIFLPITNIFETFQVNKYKNIVNNITEDFPTKISPIFGRTGYSIYNKHHEKYKTIKNMNVYRKRRNQSDVEINLGLTPSKRISFYG